MTSQNLISRLDVTGLVAVTGTSIMQVTQTAYPASDKGLVIETQDTALNTPDVPNPNVILEGVTPVEWARYIWKRVPFDITGTLKHYSWNPLIASVPTYLQWQWIESDGAAALTLAQTAIITANTALLNSNTALTAATTAQTTANNAQTTANTANSTANTALSTANTALTNVTALQTTVTNLQTQVNGVSSDLTSLTTKLSSVVLGTFFFREEYTSGTNGDNSIAATWVKRIFNHFRTDNPNLAGYCVLNLDSTITLVSGRWIIEGSFPCNGGVTGQYHKTKLRDNTTPSDILFGTSEYADTTISATRSIIEDNFEVGATTTVEIDHQGSQSIANAFGIACSMGPEIYGVLKLSYLGS